MRLSRQLQILQKISASVKIFKNIREAFPQSNQMSQEMLTGKYGNVNFVLTLVCFYDLKIVL